MARKAVEIVFRSAICLAGVHSICAGLLLMLSPAFVLSLVQWEHEGGLFFPRQCGLFLMILGPVYLAALRYRPFAAVVVGSKLAAVPFLLSARYVDTVPESVVSIAFADAFLGLVIAVSWYLAARTAKPASKEG